MNVLWLILGCILVVAAIVLVIVALEQELIVALGAAVICLVAAGYLVDRGAHGINARTHGKHVAIFSALRAQGLPIRSDDVFARNGDDLSGTEARFREGNCVFPFIARKVSGTWRVVVDRRDGNGVEILTPADVAKLAGVCAS